MSTLNLSDIPDLSGLDSGASAFEPFANGWYKGTILGKREFTDKNGNERIFESSDTPSARSNSRNIRLQVEIQRKSDGRTMNTSVLVNYQPEDLSQETVQKIAAQHEIIKQNGEDWGPLFRPYMVLSRLSKLQKIAGVRQLKRNGDGGLDLTPLYNKTGYFRLIDDTKDSRYKTVDKFQETEPKKTPVL